MAAVDSNIIANHDFSNGLQSWRANCCNGFVSDCSSYAKEIKAQSGSQFAVVSNRTDCWQGLEQDITSVLLPNVTYSVSAFVRICGSGQPTADVLATLKLEDSESASTFVQIGRAKASKEKWVELEGTFSLKSIPHQVIFYLEGPSPDIDLLIDRVHMCSASNVKGESSEMRMPAEVHNIILNPEFNMGLNSWFTNLCHGSICSDSSSVSKIEPKVYAVVSNRTEHWQGLEQDITKRVMPNVQYHVLATVRVEGPPKSTDFVQATLRLENKNVSPKFLAIARVKASIEKWDKLEGVFSLEAIPDRAVFYLEGPPAGSNLLIKRVEICPALKSDSILCPVHNSTHSEQSLKLFTSQVKKYTADG